MTLKELHREYIESWACHMPLWQRIAIYTGCGRHTSVVLARMIIANDPRYKKGWPTPLTHYLEALK